jgi:membrane protein
VGLLILSVAFAGLLKFLPDAPVRWRDALVGGFVSAALFSAGKKLFALYLAHAGMANSFGAAGSLAVLLMWLYFSALVLLLGAEFSAARGRLHDPRGPWGWQDDTPPPGSRAMLASAMAASTVAPNAPAEPSIAATMLSLDTDPDVDPAGAPNYRSTTAPRPTTTETAIKMGRSLAHAETQATRAAAATLVQAGRTAVAADRYVRRHPWRSALIAAGAAFVVTAMAGRRNDGNTFSTTSAANDDL